MIGAGAKRKKGEKAKRDKHDREVPPFRGFAASPFPPAVHPPALPSNLSLLRSLQPGRAALFWGESIRSLGAAACAWAVARGAQVLVVDAANVFDPYRLVREALRRGVSPPEALSRVRVARAFTCHQLVRLVQEELAGELSPGSLVLVLGPASLFYDEQIPLAERRRLFQNLVETLAAIKARHPLLLLQPRLSKGATNRGFGRLLMPVLDHLVEVGGGLGTSGPYPPPTPPSPNPLMMAGEGGAIGPDFPGQ